MTTFILLLLTRKKILPNYVHFYQEDDINDYQTTTKCYIKKVFMY